MAQMFPPVWPDPPPPKSEGERAVYEKLKAALPDECTVIWRFKFEWNYERDIDFLVLEPGQQIIIVEAKGGKVVVGDIESEWTDVQGNHVDNPDKQAVGIVHDFIKFAKGKRILDPRKGYGIKRCSALPFTPRPEDARERLRSEVERFLFQESFKSSDQAFAQQLASLPDVPGGRAEPLESKEIENLIGWRREREDGIKPFGGTALMRSDKTRHTRNIRVRESAHVYESQLNGASHSHRFAKWFLALGGLAGLVFLVQFLLPGLWQWWFVERQTFFWASIGVLYLSSAMFLVGTPLAKAVGSIAMFVLIAGTGWELYRVEPTQGPAPEYRPPYIPNVHIRASLKSIGFEMTPIGVDSGGRLNSIWLKIADQSPNPCLYLYGLRMTVRLCRGDQNSAPELIDGKLLIAADRERKGVSQVAYMICPQGTESIPAGCQYRDKYGTWLYRWAFGNGQPTVELIQIQ